MEAKTTISVKPDKIRLLNLLDDVAEGKISIPEFQRDFVWKKDQMKDLFDSISRGYPIGSLLFWNPDRSYKTLDKIGPYDSATPKGNYYVLDGFQRISTLFGVLTNPKTYGKKEDQIREFLVYYNLETKELNFLKNNKTKYISQIPLYKIVDTFEFIDCVQEIKNSWSLSEAQKNSLINSAKEINKIFLDYHIPFVEIIGGDIKSAVDIFSRINSTGTEISEDFMLSALSYNEETGFKLSDSISEFLNKISVYNFDLLKRDAIFNCISTATGRPFFDIKIEDLTKPNTNLEELVKSAFCHIEKAVQFLYKRLFIIDVRLLPYPTQLVFISEFFRLNPDPSEQSLLALEDWFWVTTYSNYFTLYSLSQQRSAYYLFCEFALGKQKDGIFKIDREAVFTTPRFPEKLNFTGVRPKALQLFYLRTIIGNSEISNKESIKDFFLVSEKDRTPANIILRLSSEFEIDRDKKSVVDFIASSSKEILEKHFITDDMLGLYFNGNINTFISRREECIKRNEGVFVGKLGIRYFGDEQSLLDADMGKFF